MTSASYPVGSLPATSRTSFLVHLHSLTGLSRELQTQIDGLTKPLDGVAGLIAAPPAFGPFAEATTLTAWSTAAATAMQGLIGDVGAAMQFADEVTRTVATGYAAADDDVAWGIAGRAVGTVGTVVGTVGATVGGAAGAAVGAVGGITAGVTDAVSGTVSDTVGAVGDTVGGLTGGVADTVTAAPGSIVGALTGGPTSGRGAAGLL